MRQSTCTLIGPAVTAMLTVSLFGIASAHNAQEVQGCALGPTRILERGQVSPRVYGSYTARETKAGEIQLCLLVLWRGEANWHTHRSKALEAVSKRGVNVRGDLPEVPLIHADGRIQTLYEDLGDIVVEYAYDWEGHRVNILGTDVDLGANNVLLIDHIDGRAIIREPGSCVGPRRGALDGAAVS
jgi:hypothetical protein